MDRRGTIIDEPTTANVVVNGAADVLAAAGRPAARRRTQLTDDAADYVRALIMSGQLLPGQSVRPEVIAETLGMSTTPAREALQGLRVEGFIDLLPRRGFQVAKLTGDDIRDLFQAQALIAGELASRAAQRISPKELTGLQVLHDRLVHVAGQGDFQELEEANHAFHRFVNKAAGSEKLVWVIGLLSRYVPRLFYAAIEGWPEATISDHAEILDSILARDGDRARAAMQLHIVKAGELLAVHFDERSSAGTESDT